ncbi:PolC-type DNA polymerase III [Butyricicoccus pullicaecorum]|uniref:DNA polymerase III PolC-type n=1 Tax=Butyricicoccus pullicaecorum 1.2 TaxID=1203606 RepID=R8VZJ2_9FIRM|nr:PolC-type DNA polymerase III [Butyricicoccus pullicaecorum]EOQ37869.1 DNA polymerase III, alpha subunit, Gram-positive type [Butyricicoccus pullicaecorum 1.2]SKA60499.1 DNA polymerase-3 subunit alpha [Butyricicoccus pullicaecorum DSM 23266]
MAKTLSELFDRCKSETYQDCMGGEVRSLAVSHDHQQMICHVAYQKPISLEHLDGLGKEIAQAYGLTRFSIAPRYQMDALTPEYIDLLRQDLCHRMPSATGLLAASRWDFADGHLRISMGDTARGYFSVALRQMQERIETETGQRVVVEAVPFAEEQVEKIIESQHAARNAALKAAMDAMPVAEPMPEKPRKNLKVRPAGENSGYQRPKVEKVADENLILGKLYTEEPIPIRDALGEFDRVTIKGDVFFVDHREITSKKTGKEWVKIAFDITDNTNSIRVSKFMAKDQAGDIVSAIKTGMHLIVQGKISFDSYEKESILEPTAIVKSKKKIRMDNAPEKRVELHLHTNMSAMDGVSDTKDLINRCKAWGWPAMAITDHGCAQAFPLALHVVDGKEADYPKILYGVEAYYVNDAAAVSVVRGDLDGSLDGDFIVFDLETTGLKPATEEITEIAAVLVREGEIKDSFQTYVNPHKPIPPEITELTGISDETVADAPDLPEALDKFFAFMGDRVLVAHNAGFDLSFLKAACKKLDIEREFTYIDTLEMSRIMLPHLSRFKLNILAKELQVGPFEHHRASEDAAVLGRIWVKLLDKLKHEQHASKISDINPLLAGLRAKEGGLKNLPRHHFIILVQNQVGLKNLYKLISYSFLDHFYRRPLMPRSELIKHREGLIFGSACEAGELFHAVVEGKPFEELKRIADFYDYLEIQPIDNNRFMIAKGIAEDEEALRDYNRTILKLADALGKPCCATGDVHFLDPEDEAYRRILMAGQGFPDADNQAPLYLKTTEEMLGEFAYLGEDRAYEVVITNPNKIADMLDPIRPIPRENYPPKIEGSAEELETMCREKAKRMYGDPLPEIVQARLDRELKSIIGNGYDVMYMIAQKLVSKSLQDGYLVGSRGSVGSSLVAFMSDITEVNSLAPHYLCPECKYFELHENEGVGCGVCLPDKVCPRCGTPLKKEGFSVPFETFLGFNGDKVPDIDLNFSGEYQPRIHKYTGELFGHDHVFRAGTIATVAEKTAYGYVKKYMEERGIECSRAEENRLAAGCTGIRRTTGQHPGGIVVVPKEVEIYDFCPVQHPADDPTSDIITTHFEYHSIDANLLKLDELGHDDPTIIKHLEDLTGVNAQEIPLDDPDVMSLFTSNRALHYVDDAPDPILGDLGCLAVPEFGTKFVRGMVKDTKPTTFDDLLCISGLSHGTDVWLGNAADLVASGIPLNECICCRDDIMNYLIGKGVEPKLAFQTMESVRKGKGLKPEMEEAMKANNVPDWYIDSCKKIKYMFPKAHAVAYVMMAFRIAWFKVHKPLAFYSAYFSVRAKGFDASCMIKGDAVCLDKIRELHRKDVDKTISAAEKDTQTTLEVCHEFYKRGFIFEPMDVYKSDATKFIVTEKGLIPPFTSMPGIGEQAALNIVEERKKGRFLSAEELSVRCPKVSKSVIELLGEIGALGSMPRSTQISLFG